MFVLWGGCTCGNPLSLQEHLREPGKRRLTGFDMAETPVYEHKRPQLDSNNLSTMVHKKSDVQSIEINFNRDQLDNESRTPGFLPVVRSEDRKVEQLVISNNMIEVVAKH
ncbi:hypothetical protein DPMN_161525 [Dreissena polymorpha]|uniref:Uncharacterized protein n=1 Tax=Dreissena polymorpha TaxID=45954 RepID=A0A9D4EQK6_DREPO|nr:hypothetical protein DPMN_161525 [Dreissena polymorpha]